MTTDRMPTRGWRLTRRELTEWVAALLRQGRRVVAPVQEGRLRVFRAIAAADEACLDPGKTRWSPKDVLFPKTETLFSYRVGGDGVKLQPPEPDEREQVLFGVRPCDAAGLRRLDAVFIGGQPDSLYAARRRRTTIVSLACDQAEPACFCTAVGGSPGGTDGSDVQVVSAGDAWLVRALTPSGEALTACLAGRTAASAEDCAGAAERIRQVEAAISERPVAREWAAALEASFDLPLWQALGRRCLGCSICTYVCPSCSCFDVQDSGNAWCGERCRSWDSCTFALFTRHASGHNPRPTQASRYRQRVLHKFAYFPLQNGGELMCVGCGRCVALCPVGMNVHESVRGVMAASQEANDARR